MIQSKQPQQNVGRWAVVDWLFTIRLTTFFIKCLCSLLSASNLPQTKVNKLSSRKRGLTYLGLAYQSPYHTATYESILSFNMGTIPRWWSLKVYASIKSSPFLPAAVAVCFMASWLDGTKAKQEMILTQPTWSLFRQVCLLLFSQKGSAVVMFWAFADVRASERATLTRLRHAGGRSVGWCRACPLHCSSPQ